MQLTDPVSDLLVRIRNALKEKKENVKVPYSTIKEEIVKIFIEEGYVNKYEKLQRGSRKFIRLVLKYDENKTSIITKLERVSTPSRRYYVKASQIPKVLGGFGVSILSTSKGILSNEKARRAKVGGELLLKIW